MDTTPGRVLILGQNASMQKLAARVSSWPDCEVQVVDSPEHALELSHTVDVDILICDLDIDVPDANWTEWQHQPALQPFIVPTLMVRQSDSSSGVDRTLYFGSKGFVVIPMDDWVGLQDAVLRCIEFGRLRRANVRYREKMERSNSELQAYIKLLEQDQLAGRHVQMKMLPQTPLPIGEYTFNQTVVPSLYLSGDFIDYFLVGDNHAVFFIADVSGHGSSSAFVTVLLKNLFARKRSHFLHRSDNTILSPSAMLSTANDDLLATGVGKHATMCVGIIDLNLNVMTFSVAGHLPLPVLVSDEGVEYLQGKGSPVGLFREAEYTERQLALPEKFMLAIFSDGLLEILPPQDLIAKEQHLLQVFENHHLEGEQKILQRLGVEGMTEAPDDIAALFVSRGGL